MARVSYTATAHAGLPVDYRFRCAKCGKDVRTTRYMQLSASSGNSGDILYTQNAARNRLSVTVASQVKAFAENTELGGISISTTPNGPLPSAPLTCPLCGLANWPKAGHIPRLLRPKWFAPSLIAFPVILIVATLMTMDWELHEFNLPAWFLIAVPVAFFAYLALFFAINRAMSKRAFDHPALMEKLYRGVFNDAIYADLTLYGFGEIRVGSKQ